jgi:SOS-response transcriptional repressor LexA
MMDNDEDKTDGSNERNSEVGGDVGGDGVLAAWHSRRSRDRNSAYFRDDRFVEWLARDARESLADGARSNEFTDDETLQVAQSLQAYATAAKSKVVRVFSAPEYHAPTIVGSAQQVAEQAAHVGSAPFLDLGVAAGIGRELWDEECSSWVRLPKGIPKGSYVALKVNGESMMPLLHSGDVMAVRLDSPFSSGDIVIARLEDDGFVVKRVGRVTPTFVELVSINPAFGSIEVPRSIQPVVGVVILCWCEHQLPPR